MRVRTLPRLVSTILLVVCAAIAAAHDRDMPRPDAVLARVATAADAAQEYSLYLPPGYPTAQGSPLLVILDARGRAESSLLLAEDAARANRWIVMSSWQSASDTNESGTLRALQALLGEAFRRYRIDRRRIYVAGLSGTAKTLWTRADMLAPLLAGVIGASGGRPPELGALRRPPGFAFAGVAGTGDFNYFEMRDLDAELARVGSTHRFFLFQGDHDWPPSGVYGQAIDWLELVAMRDGLSRRRSDFITAGFQRDHDAADTANGLERWHGLEQMLLDYRGLHELAALRGEVAALALDPALEQDRQRERRIRADEAEATHRLDAWIARVGAESAIGRHDSGDVRGAFADLRIDALHALAAGSDRMFADSATRRLRRIDAFTGFYLPAQFLARGQSGRAISMLRLSLALNPMQPGVHWQLAKAMARAGNRDAAFAQLREARDGGAFDAESLREDPAWSVLRDDPRWPELIGVAR